MKNINQLINTWYHGELIIIDPVGQHHKNDVVGILPETKIQIHWAARLCRFIVSFYLRNWQWLWRTLIGVLAALGIFKTFSGS